MEDVGVLSVSTYLFSFHKPRKKIKIHGDYGAQNVGIGDLGINKGKSKAIEKNQKTRSNLASPEFVSGLRRIFSEKISFKRVSSVGKTSMTSRRSSSAKRRSNSSVNKPVIDENLIKDVEAAIFKLLADRIIRLKDVEEVNSYLLSNELLCKAFVCCVNEERVDEVKELLTKCITHS